MANYECKSAGRSTCCLQVSLLGKVHSLQQWHCLRHAFSGRNQVAWMLRSAKGRVIPTLIYAYAFRGFCIQWLMFDWLVNPEVFFEVPFPRQPVKRNQKPKRPKRPSCTDGRCKACSLHCLDCQRISLSEPSSTSAISKHLYFIHLYTV